MRRKSFGAISLAVLLAASMTACASTGDASERVIEKIVEVEKEVIKEVSVPRDYFDVTAINGLIKDQDYNHEKVEKEQSVTVVAEVREGKSFLGWYDGDELVSAGASYTFTPTENTVLTAVYETYFSKWSGDYPADKPEGFVENVEEKTWHITTADGLAYWAAMITANENGTDPNASRYSAFNYANYARIISGIEADHTPTDEEQKSAVAQSRVDDNAWTLSLEANIDLGGYEWTPINDCQWALQGFTFNGNGNIIKNLHVKAIKSIGQQAAGFFGLICNEDFTIKDVTFTDATIVSDVSNDADKRMQNFAVVVGFINQNLHYSIYGTPETVVFDNVNVYNSTVGDNNAYKVGFLVGRSGEYATATDYVQYYFLNCDVSGNTMVGQRIFGGLIGYAAHAGDSDISVSGGDQLTVNTYNTRVTDNTIVTSYQNKTNGVYNFGSICSGDAASEFPTGGWGSIKYTENLKGVNNTLIDLHCGNAKVATTAAQLRNALEAMNEDETHHSITEIFVIGDINMEDVADVLEWEANDEQVIYLVAGAKVEGLELGENVRYINGERNEDGKLIVTDKDGAELGVWEVAEDGKSAAFVAKQTEETGSETGTEE